MDHLGLRNFHFAYFIDIGYVMLCYMPSVRISRIVYYIIYMEMNVPIWTHETLFGTLQQRYWGVTLYIHRWGDAFKRLFAVNLPKQYLFQIDMNGVTLFMFFFGRNKILLPINFVGFLFTNVNGNLFEL